jgi:hypothetical protein
MWASMGSKSIDRLNISIGLMVFVSAVMGLSANATAQPLYPQIITNRGCGENALFQIGERANIYLRVNGYSNAGGTYIRIWNLLSDDRWQLVKETTIALRRTYRIRVRFTSSDAGLLVLQAWTSRTAASLGFTPYESRCAFYFIYFFEIPPIPQIETNRGCGAPATFAAGELMNITYKVDGGQSHERAYIQLFKELRTGELQLIKEQVVWYGQTASLTRKIQLNQSGRLVLYAWASSQEFRDRAQPAIAECLFTLNGIKSSSSVELAPEFPNTAVQARLFDLHGRMVYSSSWMNSRELDMDWKKRTASLPNGVYWALVYTQDQKGEIRKKAQQFVVKR